MFQFELHSHIGEIRRENLVYEKGGVIKHFEAPAINKVELLDLGKMDLMTMWNSIFCKKVFSYIIVILQIVCMTRFGISL